MTWVRLDLAETQSRVYIAELGKKSLPVQPRGTGRMVQRAARIQPWAGAGLYRLGRTRCPHLFPSH